MFLYIMLSLFLYILHFLLLLGKVICFILVSTVLLICRMSLIFVWWTYTHRCLFKCCSLPFNVCLFFFLCFILKGHWPFYFCPSNLYLFCFGFHPFQLLILVWDFPGDIPAFFPLDNTCAHSASHPHMPSLSNPNLIAQDREQQSSSRGLPQTLTHRTASYSKQSS